MSLQATVSQPEEDEAMRIYKQIQSGSICGSRILPVPDRYWELWEVLMETPTGRL